MKLHGDLLSPFVRMCMATAIEAGLSGRVQLLSAILKPQEVHAALAALSPIGKIPILETDHGHALYDSRVIMEYLCHVAGNKVLLVDEGNAHFHILTLLALAQGLGDAAVALRYETFMRPEATRWPELAERQRARIYACVDELENKWHEHFKDVTLGTIAVAVVLGYLDVRHGALDWRNNRPRLSAFQESFAKRDSMINTQPKV
jgi:glutathione S-transferase